MQIRLLFLLIFITAACGTRESENLYDEDLRTKNFPQVVIRAEKLPKPENLWVFIMAGQSNMAGRAIVEPQDTLPSNRIISLNVTGETIIAKEPIHFYEPARTGLDCGLTFGKELIRYLPDSISVLIIPTAIGGSTLDRWLGNYTFRNVQLYQNFAEKIKLGRKLGTLKGILWHQGESDAIEETDIATYEEKLAKLFANFRKDSNDENLPILIGLLGSYSENQQNWNRINSQIYNYASKDSLVSLVPTDDLRDKGDKLHFDSESQRILGKRYANLFLRNYQ